MFWYKLKYKINSYHVLNWKRNCKIWYFLSLVICLVHQYRLPVIQYLILWFIGITIIRNSYSRLKTTSEASYWIFSLFMFKVLKYGTRPGLSSSGAVNSSYQRSFREIWWCAWAWLPLCPLVHGQSNSWLSFFACAAARCLVWNQDKGFFLKTKMHNKVECMLLPDLLLSTFHQDNVFVTVVASVQYRALAEKVVDAFYRLTNTREQIQAYVFDGVDL